MGTTKKLAIGLGLASGALLAAYLFTGRNADKAKQLISKAADGIKERLDKAKRVIADDSDIYT
ncbi:MAG TPA: hypothetical protein PKC24_14505 [Cyclobacteriaceae bacterium]|nr:hypothetical protein [Cyclobacteriaceae bacterium]